MKKNKKRVRKAFLFIKGVIRLIDKKIITPITKFILLITDKMGRRTDKFERWLVRKNTLVFLSLLIDSVNNLSCCYCHEYTTLKILAAVLPIGMFLFVLYIRKCITRYIHYQRMREIQYTLQIYSQTKNIIEFRQEYYATEGYYQTNQCCHNKTKECSLSR
jgi:hypothetical protein